MYCPEAASLAGAAWRLTATPIARTPDNRICRFCPRHGPPLVPSRYAVSVEKTYTFADGSIVIDYKSLKKEIFIYWLDFCFVKGLELLLVLNVEIWRFLIMLKTLLSIASLALAVVVAAPAQAAPTFYNSRATFLSQLGASVTDDYSNPAYAFNQNNAVMSAVLGETDYFTTGFSNLNLVPNANYCAGCNGSFRLDFTSTSVGGANGVFGAGVDILFDQGYFAFITYGDNTTGNIDLGAFSGFFGVTALEDIKSIHFGLSNGGTTTQVSFQVDNLTIGGNGTPVPEPATLALLGFGLLGVAASRRRKQS